MAERKTRRRKTRAEPAPPLPLWRWALIWAGRGLFGLGAFYGALILIFSFAPPPFNIYQLGESLRLGGISRDWVDMEEIAPVMARSVVAAEDANFCLHWGFDMAAIRDAIDAGANRGASTLSQQTVKNVFLWQGRSWARKAMEAVMTPLVELMWSKRRILEMYLNEAEFAEGVFGVQAAAQDLFGVDARDLSATQAARLAAVLPNPQEWHAAKPGPYVRRRASQIASGAETIETDGRADCFEALH